MAASVRKIDTQLPENHVVVQYLEKDREIKSLRSKGYKSVLGIIVTLVCMSKPLLPNLPVIISPRFYQGIEITGPIITSIEILTILFLLNSINTMMNKAWTKKKEMTQLHKQIYKIN